MLNIRLRLEFENRYAREVQALCKTEGFGMVDISCPGDVNRTLLESIVSVATNTAPLLCKMITAVGLSSWHTPANASHLAAIRIVSVLVILCRSAHRNNSNYIPLLIALYLYSAGARVDTITLLNHLGLLISYNVLQ